MVNDSSDIVMNKSKAHLLLLYLLKRLNEITEEANIPYYASGGTCLGAIRHNGFIPWDDDIDVMIPRKYYNDFVEICKKRLKSPVTIRTRENDPFFCCEYIKLCFRDDIIGYSDLSIDVSFLDETNPRRKLFRALQNFLLTQLYYLKVYKLGRLGLGKLYKPNSLLRHSWLWFWSFFFSLPKIDQWNRVIMLAEKNNGDYWINWGSCYHYSKATYSKKALGIPKKVPFEDTYVYAAEHTEEILQHLYGSDYMSLPPPEKRTEHMVREIHCSELYAKGILKE